MLWEMGISCRERSKGIVNVCKGLVEVGYYDNVMKVISKVIKFFLIIFSSLEFRMRIISN